MLELSWAWSSAVLCKAYVQQLGDQVPPKRSFDTLLDPLLDSLQVTIGIVTRSGPSELP